MEILDQYSSDMMQSLFKAGFSDSPLDLAPLFDNIARSITMQIRNENGELVMGDTFHTITHLHIEWP